jgi:hypothetical protein
VAGDRKGTVVTSYSGLPNKLVSTERSIDFAYREAGEGFLRDNAARDQADGT